MCVQCEVRRVRDVLASYREDIRVRGWAVASVAPTAQRVGFSYTIGLTRHHGHPELLASGLAPREAVALLAEFVPAVRAGQRFEAGDVLAPQGAHRLQLVAVTDPQRLEHAQAIYAARPGYLSRAAAVPGLQVVWSDHDGHWPWQPGWPGRASDQPLFGLPLHH